MLSVLIWFPIVGAVLLAFAPGAIAPKNTRLLALVLSLILFGYSLLLLTQFDLSQAGFQMVEYLPWLPFLGLSYSLAADGLSLPLVVMTGLLTWVAMASAPIEIHRPRLFYSLILLVYAGLAGAFLAQNLLFFVLFYEVELIPLYLLISIWGSEKRDYAAMKFLIYTAVSGILILGAFIALAVVEPGKDLSFDYATLQNQAKVLPIALQTTLLVVLLIGFGIKTPLVPFHTWLPDTYVESSTPVVILLGGLLAKLGTYGLVRFCLGLFPEAWANLSPFLSVWGVSSVLYGAIVAIAQRDIKRMVAYSSIGHMGYVLLAASAVTPLALVGSMTQMLSHGLILAALFYLVGIVEAKVGTRDLDILNGLLNPIRGLPLTSALLIVMGMASAGIPGMMGFVSEFLVFQGSFAVFPWQTLLCIAGSGLSAVYFVILLNRTCFGRLDNRTAYYPRVAFVEQVPALVLAALILFLGVQPTWLVRWSEKTATALIAQVPSTTLIAQKAVLPAAASAVSPSPLGR